ncbi:hypothetical protein BDF22DRAFT_143943 [Syncephalis plumigaleata]|nr:hypothetical protein BDF22DRAFT_143943 [Syncephalis plumigaleata]
MLYAHCVLASRRSLFLLGRTSVSCVAYHGTRYLSSSTAVADCRPVRGMRDRFAPETRLYRRIIEQGRSIAESHGFSEVVTPILEHAEVFERSLGTSSDVIGKELYKFTDKNGTALTLRPEGTAGIVRALISSHQIHGKSSRLFYHGPMFRHERPQKGRLRQFEQFGVEMLGYQHPSSDVELVQMGWSFIQRLNLPGAAKLEINSIGNMEERRNYIEILRRYFSQNKATLSTDSQRRLTENPLRILDSKSPEDQSIIAQAPRITDHLTAESRKRFLFVCQMLHALDIPHTINWRLVRGLDYYNDTVWEIKYTDTQLGASQDTILAGGRYDTLVGTLSGGTNNVPAVGWAAGIDRLALLLAQSKLNIEEDGDNSSKIAVISLPMNTNGTSPSTTSDVNDGQIYALTARIADKIRQSGYSCTMLHQTTWKVQRLGRVLGQASEMNIKVAILIGENEVGTGQLAIRHLGSREQCSCTFDELPGTLARWLKV